MIKLFRTFFPLFLSLLLGLFLIGCSNDNKVTPTSTPTPTANSQENTDTGLLSGKHNIEIEIEGYGIIALTLDADIAPITVTNFIKLTKEGFYNGLTFHRIISGFMIQGGDPEGNGYGGSDECIKGEFSANGVVNDLKHERGVISMARSSQSMDSASSQFFIMQVDYPSLDGLYAAFGYVTSGIEIVDAICEETPVGNNGAVLPKNQPKIKEIRVVE